MCSDRNLLKIIELRGGKTFLKKRLRIFGDGIILSLTTRDKARRKARPFGGRKARPFGGRKARPFGGRKARNGMNRYTIKTTAGRKIGSATAEDAPSALTIFSSENLDSDYGFQRGGQMVDADTRGMEWATIRTDGGTIEAVRA